jgi:hypothetical protein
VVTSYWEFDDVLSVMMNCSARRQPRSTMCRIWYSWKNICTLTAELLQKHIFSHNDTLVSSQHNIQEYLHIITWSFVHIYYEDLSPSQLAYSSFFPGDQNQVNLLRSNKSWRNTVRD